MKISKVYSWWDSCNFLSRDLSQCSVLTFEVRQSSFTKGSEVFGSFSRNDSLSTIGFIAKEWNEWLYVLSFIPSIPSWVWIMDKNCNRLVRRLHPSLQLIDEFPSSLPVVDIVLLSRVTLRQ